MASLINSDGNWATLPMELLSMILTKLVLLPDYIRFGAVCKDWYRVALDQEQHRIETCYQQPPMLFISGSQEQNCFYSLWEHKVYNSHIPMIPDGIMFCGLCYGWLAVEQENAAVTLVNLLNGKIIHLPPLKITFPRKYNIFKVILSCDPCLHPNDCAVAAIYEQDQNVAIIRPGENSWTYLYHNFVDEEFEHVIDIYFYKGHLYAVNCFYELVSIDYSGCATSFDPSDNSRKEDESSVPSVGGILPQDGYISNNNYCQENKASENSNLSQTSYNERDEYLHNDDLPDANFTEGHKVLCSVCCGSVSLEKLIWTDDWYVYSWNSDLVESFEGDLLLVQRNGYQGFSDEVTMDFKILKLVMNHSSDDDADKARWVEIQSLGNSAIFLGVNHSICISATSFPNIQPNCIYYISTKHYPHETVDVGIFSLESRKIVEYSILPDSLRYMSAAEWISPKLGVKLKKPVQSP